MLQFFIVLLSCVACGLTGYPDSTSGNAIGNNGNYGYGYSGSYSGGGMYSYSHASSSPNGNARASSSITFGRKGILNQAQATQNFAKSGAPTSSGSGAGGFGGGYSDGQSFGGSFSGSFPGQGFQFIPGSGVGGTFNPSGNGASAFGSIGPDGIQQKAAVFPENPNSPNVQVRFDAGDNPGFKSVFSSSSSYTTNVDGQPKTVKQATTTVNDNGKVTTYTAKSP